MKMDAIWDHAKMPVLERFALWSGSPPPSHRPDAAVGWIVCVPRTWAASAHGVGGLHAPSRGHLDAAKQRQALREFFSVARAVPSPATPHDDRFLDGRAGAWGVARFAQPER